MSADYEGRRSRVAMQVVSRWKGDDFADDEMLTVIAAADMTFTSKINDLDWEAATLARLRKGQGE